MYVKLQSGNVFICHSNINHNTAISQNFSSSDLETSKVRPEDWQFLCGAAGGSNLQLRLPPGVRRLLWWISWLSPEEDCFISEAVKTVFHVGNEKRLSEDYNVIKIFLYFYNED